MEWQQIMGFYHVARLGSFTRAGEVTLRTQSALSQQVKALEEEFGCRLFERIGTRRLKLTPFGERFLRFSESVLKGYQDLAGDLDALRGTPRGPLRVAAPFTTLYHLFPEKIRDYRGCFPEVEITLLDRPQASVVALVKDGEVDFGLALESFAPKDLATIRWKSVETVLMVPEGHPLVPAKRVTWTQIAKYPLILPPRDSRYGGRNTLEEEFEKRGLDHRIAMESSNVELSSLYVEMGLGISLATIVAGLPVLKQRKLAFLPLNHYFKGDHIVVVMRKDKVLGAHQRAFINTLFGEAVLADA
jgi:DNA-binding transcriptional LysR family regulator